MKKEIIKSLLIILMPLFLTAQYNHQFVHFDLEGETLLNKLRDDYTPTDIYDYNDARDILFSKVYNVNDSLSGIYTGMRLYMDPSLDPTQAVYLNGIANGINTEHCFPRSKGAQSGNAKSDMHHLFPSRIATNSDRGNLPYGDINDNITKKWYWKTTTRTQKPTQNIDFYSEWIGDHFEPRESVKGNIARAMFYFFTIYHDKAMAADPNFFKSQRAILCKWHEQDLIDSTEWARTMKIASYQDNLANPFILDCSLAQRAYCPEITSICYPDGVKEEEPIHFSLGENYPNPFVNKTTIPANFKSSGHIVLSYYRMFDQKKIVVFEGNVKEGNNSFVINKDLFQGIYIYEIKYTPLGKSKAEILNSIMIKID